MLDFGAKFAKNSPRVIELTGDVGAGKTTFTRGFAKGLGISAPVTSPSFTISKSYPCPDGRTLVHYDFYRLSDPGVMLADLTEAVGSPNNIVIVEWADTVQGILPPSHTVVNISRIDEDAREVTIKQNDASDDDAHDSLGRAKAPELAPREVCSTAEVRQDSARALRLYLDTSSSTTVLRLNDSEYKWESGRDLAEKLLSFLHDRLAEHGKDFHDIAEITFMSGPGSFTGLRIGAAVVNTLAHELNIPLYTHTGRKVPQIIPDYGRPANITAPKK